MLPRGTVFHRWRPVHLYSQLWPLGAASPPADPRRGGLHARRLRRVDSSHHPSTICTWEGDGKGLVGCSNGRTQEGALRVLTRSGLDLEYSEDKRWLTATEKVKGSTVPHTEGPRCSPLSSKGQGCDRWRPRPLLPALCPSQLLAKGATEHGKRGYNQN